jgi:hypothetical protein
MQPTALPRNEGDDESPSLQAAMSQLHGLLVEGETLRAWAVQRRVFALSHRRILAAATSGRLILLARRLLGGFAPQDIRWQDLTDARLDVGLLGADLVVSGVRAGDLAGADQGTRTLVITGLRKEQATTVYRICQSEEQNWREKRRVRELEELRAKSGGVTLGSQGFAAPASSAEPDPASRLQKAKEMLHEGLITDAEYESIKARIVSGL